MNDNRPYTLGELLGDLFGTAVVFSCLFSIFLFLCFAF